MGTFTNFPAAPTVAHPIVPHDGQPNQPPKSKKVTEARRAARAAKHAAAIAAFRERPYDHRILTFEEAAEIKGVSLATLRRDIARGKGPKVTELSERRRGITSDNMRAHLESRSA